MLMTTQASNSMAIPAPQAKFLSDRWRNRVIAACVVVPCVTVLGLALWLTPEPHGAGTHTQLGLAPCQFFLRTAMPCPTCGMTTAVTYAVRCYLIAALIS